MVVIAGAPLTLLDSLLAHPDAPLALADVGGAWVVVRSGPQVEARAYTPGARQARVIDPGHLADAMGRARPPRRLDVRHPAPLLEHLTLVAVPPQRSDRVSLDQGLVTAPSDVVDDALASAMGFVLVTTGPDLSLDQRRLLREAGTRTCRVACLVLTRGEPITRAEPLPVGEYADPGGVDGEIAWHRDDVDGLRQTLLRWASEAADSPAEPRTTADRRTPGVAPDDRRWRATLCDTVARARAEIIAQVSEDCAALHGRLMDVLCRCDDCRSLPEYLDQRLHALSVRVSRDLEAWARVTADTVCSVLVGDALGEDTLDRAVVTRFREAVRRSGESLDPSAAGPHALLLTTTTAVATIAGEAALDALTAVGLPSEAGIVPPVAIAVNSGCFQLWQKRDSQGTARAATWASRAVRGAGEAVISGVNQRCDLLERAVEAVAADAVDHGFLLV